MFWLVLTACDVPPPTYVYGVLLPETEFSLYSRDMGVYPDRSVLRDPNNPFRWGMDEEMKWTILDSGEPVAAFYAWATQLARIPIGENQYFAANQAQAIYELGLSDPGDAVFVRDIAIRGYQTVLDEFPDSVIYDATGRDAYPLAPLAYDGIESLGGTVQGGWSRIALEDGTVIVVQTGGTP